MSRTERRGAFASMLGLRALAELDFHAVLHKVGCAVPYQVHAGISYPMSGDDHSTATLETWAFLIQAIDEAGDNEDAVVRIPTRVTIDINKAVIPAFEGKVLRAVLPVDVGDDAEYEVDLVDDTTPI
ncbi:hypothetical protein QFC22_004768 [Naganishia vaughanmartiniae]|uniref:Uncharacterized protein n=1 Tax=Naganishia vaughanmartiniae TaxID=1424756 RepID=A0ACC2WXY9_9TREE|nr:hypothetical protein QFC22_004768 [Naganishia vaughanmartiniae]